MKILALGDNQLGATTVPLDEQEKVWDSIVDVAIDRSVDAVVHAGDLLEGPVVRGEDLRAFRRPLAKLRGAGIPTLLIRGNHDSAVRPVDALDVFHEYPLLTVVQRPSIHLLKGAAFCCLPWVHKGSLVAHLNGAVDHDAANATASELLVEIAADLRSKIPSDALSRVLVVHWAISGSALPTGLSVDEMREPILPWSELDALGFHVVIGGHIHEAQQISDPRIDSTLGIVVGSPQQLNFGEHGEHGCWVVDLAGTPEAEFVPIDSPRFVTLDYDPATFNEPKLVDELRDGDYVRVRFTATEDEAKRVDHDAIRRELESAGAANVRIEPQIVRTSRSRAEGISEQLSQVEALVQWCNANEIEAAMRERIVGRFQEWT